MNEETEVEWAVQYRSYLNGKFDRTVVYPSEAKAKEQVKKFNARAKPGADCRAAYHYVTKWRPA